MIKELENFTSKYHGIFDSHAHYNDSAFDSDREELLSSLPSLGVENAVCVGYDLPSSQKAVEIAEQYPHIYAAAGFHPENLEEYSEDGIDRLRPLLAHPKTVAIGEIGLDYHWPEPEPAECREHSAHDRFPHEPGKRSPDPEQSCSSAGRLP